MDRRETNHPGSARRERNESEAKHARKVTGTTSASSDLSSAFLGSREMHSTQFNDGDEERENGGDDAAGARGEGTGTKNGARAEECGTAASYCRERGKQFAREHRSRPKRR